MKKTASLLIALVLLISCNEEKPQPQPLSISDFIFSGEHLTQNQPFEIEYTGEGQISNGFYHSIVHDKAYPQDLVFNGNKASLTVPDSVSLVSFFFRIDKDIDNFDGNGYLFFNIDSNGEKAKDALAAKENYLLNLGSSFGLTSGDTERAFAQISQVITDFSELKDRWVQPQLQTARRLGKAKTNQLVAQYLGELNLNSNSKLNDYKKAKMIYSAARQFDNNDSINNIIIDKFPESEEAKSAIVENYFKFKSADERIEYFNNENLDQYKTNNMDFVYTNMANISFARNNFEKFEEYINKVKRIQSKASLYNNLAWENANKGENLEYVSEISKKSLDLVSNEIKELSQKSEFYSPSQYKEQLSYTYKMYADTYAYIQYKSGNLDKAIEYQEKVVDDGLNPDFNERYIQFLVEDEQFEKVIESASSFIKNGNATKKLKEDLKLAYDKTGTEVDFDAVLADLEAQAREKYKTEIGKRILNKDAPNFLIKNIKGENVSLSSLRGKVVILDFWATWCGPCIASFPGMQNAVEKYKDEEDVEFLFIDTMENGNERLETVQSFIEKNKYDFHVLIDPFSNDTGSYEVANAYGVSGIPTKFIIDKEGKMRFKDVGFSGSTDKLLNKIDVMIELIR
jgi:thiol-disulfide isomerase/thioredoxin